MKLRALLLASFLLATSAPSYAQPSAEAKQLAQEVLDLTASESLAQSVRQLMTPTLQNLQKQVSGQKLNSKQQEILQRHMTEFTDDMMGADFLGKVKASMLDAYATVYTLDELRGIRDFYRSPAGIAFAQKAPQVISQSAPMMQSLMPPMMERIRARSARIIEELKAAE